MLQGIAILWTLYKVAYNFGDTPNIVERLRCRLFVGDGDLVLAFEEALETRHREAIDDTRGDQS